jgi:hypothetical protein
MAEAGPATRELETRTTRLATRLRGSPPRLSLAIGGAFAAVFLLVELTLGRLPIVFGPASHPRGDFRLALVLIALAAYLPGAFAYARRGARETIGALGPALRCSQAELAALRAATGRFPPGALRAAGWIGLAAMLLVPLATNGTLRTYDPRTLPPEAIFHRLFLPWIGWFLGRFVYGTIAESRRLSRIGRTLVRVDLLDLRPLAPITRQGMRQAGIAAGLLSILALALVDVDLAPNLLAVLGAGLAANGLLSATALLLPLRGVRDAIAAAKAAELDAARDALRAARDGAPSAPSLADVLAWRSYVASVPEWPFDAPTLLRFALYLAIPLGSWLGGALVEHVVDRWLS